MAQVQILILSAILVWLYGLVKYLDLTLPGPALNLACDEALLDACEGDGVEVLRFWEPQDYFAVVGYANTAARELDLTACARENVPVFRRCSGGGTVLQGPGCLNYAVVLRIDGHDDLQTITSANCHIMKRQRNAISTLVKGPVTMRGHTDLCLGERKFSGNAQRRKRDAVLFHGTFLLEFDLARIEHFLPMPSRHPEYRQGREHGQFLTNLHVPAAAVKDALRREWSVQSILETPPDCAALAAEKYSRDDWNLKF